MLLAEHGRQIRRKLAANPEPVFLNKDPP